MLYFIALASFRRLPCFLIATVDKFAALPWAGEVGAFFGRVEWYDKKGLYGPCQPTKVNPLAANGPAVDRSRRLAEQLTNHFDALLDAGLLSQVICS